MGKTYYNYHCPKCGLDGILENETTCPYCEEPVDEKRKARIEVMGSSFCKRIEVK